MVKHITKPRMYQDPNFRDRTIVENSIGVKHSFQNKDEAERCFDASMRLYRKHKRKLQ